MSTEKNEVERKAPRRSSLKANNNEGIDPNLLKIKKGVRHSVSFGTSNTFKFKAMKAMFEESHDASKPNKIKEEEHKNFVETRKKSIKNEFSLVKEMMKNKYLNYRLKSDK